MDALTALLTRSSIPKLCDPLPDQGVLDNIYRAAFRAADHAVLRPWRLLAIEGASRHKLGELFAQATQQSNPDSSAEKLDRMRAKPLRAPLIITVVSCYQPHPKVPEIEQDLCAGAAAQNMITAAFAQGVGAIWRTGNMAYHPSVKAGLGLATNEKIIGFLYLGRIDGATKQLAEPNVAAKVEKW